ncbi:MAG: metallophosphoesterase family protein [Sphingorhabdus sp.]
MKIAVMGDIHGAAGPYRVALDTARREGFDQLLIIGDLLTYGVDPLDCLALTREAIEKDKAVLVAGNHDQLYLDMDTERSAYFDALPDWIKESVRWTWEKIAHDFPDTFDWQEQWSFGSLLVAHANPFGYGDWTYLRSDAEQQRAAAALAAKGYRHGLFGHTHRSSHYTAADAVEIYTIGSLGQPRDKQEPRPQWAMIEITDGQFSLDLRYISYDWQAHKDAIFSTSLSDGTKARLCGFYT